MESAFCSERTANTVWRICSQAVSRASPTALSKWRAKLLLPYPTKTTALTHMSGVNRERIRIPDAPGRHATARRARSGPRGVVRGLHARSATRSPRRAVRQRGRTHALALGQRINRSDARRTRTRIPRRADARITRRNAPVGETRFNASHLYNSPTKREATKLLRS